ncbi:MAG: amidohydrolase family protein [Clostridiales Family XIII bacterium]|jgi:predicted TIM-barrel fold metal-dependent hydrolase|nr:amidohydrolase family protein [Clostridiales Family XIII bacterium]
MIIDHHNHIWVGEQAGGFLDEGMSVERILREMDVAGVDMAGVCTVAQAINNDYVVEAQNAHPDRLFGFCMINPRLPDAGATLRHYLDKGLKGLKLHPRLHGYQLGDHALLDPLIAICGEYGVPVFSHGGSEENDHPFYFEELARSFPKVRFLLGHMCALNFCDDAIRVAQRNGNIYLDTSTAELFSVKAAIKQVGADRIVMSTDWPGNDFRMELLKIQIAADGNEDVFGKIAGENIRRIMNL